MRRRMRWLVPPMLAAGTAAWLLHRRGDLGRLAESLRRYSAPTATLYDAMTAPFVDRLFTRVADDVAEVTPGAPVLEIGPGPGRLALKLAALDPGVRITGVDIAPDMVERASRLAARSEVADRVWFEVGDVAALPFHDATFQFVLSTFSAHHWPDPAAALAEIHRVLRSGGVAWIYDLPDWFTRVERRGASISELADASPFGGQRAWTQSVAGRLGPIRLLYRTELRR